MHRSRWVRIETGNSTQLDRWSYPRTDQTEKGPNHLHAGSAWPSGEWIFPAAVHGRYRKVIPGVTAGPVRVTGKGLNCVYISWRRSDCNDRNVEFPNDSPQAHATQQPHYTMFICWSKLPQLSMFDQVLRFVSLPFRRFDLAPGDEDQVNA